jgi:hypothetical protein
MHMILRIKLRISHCQCDSGRAYWGYEKQRSRKEKDVIMISARRLFATLFVYFLISLVACGGSSTSHAGNTSGNSSPSGSGGSTTSKSAGATGICTLLSKDQIQQIFGFTVGFTNFNDPLASSATDRSAMCVFAPANLQNDSGVILSGNVSTTPDGAKQALQLEAGDNCQSLAGFGDEACTDYDSTTSSFEIWVVKGDTEFNISRYSPNKDTSVPGKLQQAARVILGEVH